MKIWKLQKNYSIFSARISLDIFLNGQIPRVDRFETISNKCLSKPHKAKSFPELKKIILEIASTLQTESHFFH